MSGTDIVQRTPEQELVAQLRSDTVQQQLEVVLPPTVTIERFTRIAATAVLTNPDIAKIGDKQSILRAFMQAAADGLMPDGREGAIVGRGNKAVWQPMIGGLRRQIADYGWALTTTAVYEADDFDWIDEPHHRMHRQAPPGVDRGDIVGAYAIATHRDGREQTLFMRWSDIEKRKSVATTKAVWDKWPAEMSEKTVGRALVKKLPLAEADRERLLRIIDTAELAPGEAATALYGPPGGRTPAALPAGDTAASDASPSTTTSESASVGGGNQQAELAAAPETPAASSAPDLDPDFADEHDQVDDEIVTAGREAAEFVVPFGTTWKGKTLAEVHEAGETGRQWFAKMLEKLDAARYPEFRTALWAFARVYLPEEYEAALAREEAQAA